MGEKKPSSFAEFFVDAPLYASVVLDLKPNEAYRRVPLPGVIRRHCSAVGCRAELDWRLDAPGGSAEYAREGVIEGRQYTCRNCDSAFNVWFFWRRVKNDVVAVKIGQYPPLDTRLPQDLEKALGEAADLWGKGIRSRHQGYGIGALAYFRRVIEGSTGKLLALLADAMTAAGEPAADVQAVRDLIAAKAPFDTKMEQAAKMIPRSLRPGGANPFQTMFEILSGGIHWDSDEECCMLVDALANALALIVARLNAHIDEQKAYEAAVKDVEGLRTRRENK